MKEKKDIKQSIRVRFAPSPTGYLHIGNLRAALFNWLFARHTQGTFLIRIEDTDLERSKEEYTESILSSLDWVGITSDEPLIFQSARSKEHKKILNYLIEVGYAYRCFCSPEEILARQKKKFGEDYLFESYDGFCRDRISVDDDVYKPHVVRFKVPFEQGHVTFNDLIRGPISFDLHQLDDFIIARSDGNPVYNFVVVVDDAYMRISHVIRGEDHISNTPKQILLYHACGYEVPQFAHLPLILGPSGDRLSKRDGATSVCEYRAQGYLAPALCNYLVRLGWSHGDQEIFTRQELIDYFSLDHVGKKGAIFDKQKLDWLNGIYIRQTDEQELFHCMLRDVDPELRDFLTDWTTQQILELIVLYKQRAKTLLEISQGLKVLYAGPDHYDDNALKKWVTAATIDVLRTLITRLEGLSFSTQELMIATKDLCHKLDVKLVSIAQPIRIALTGNDASPGVFELMTIVGKERSLSRLRTFVLFLEEAEGKKIV